MPNPMNFDEASAGAAALFDNEQLNIADAPTTEEAAPPANGGQGTDTPPADTPPADAPPVDTPPAEGNPPADVPPTDNQTMLDQAAQTAEVAAQVASQTNQENEALRQQIAQLQAQNQQLQGTIDEMSQQQQQSVVENALKQPTIDFDSMAFADEDTRAAEMSRFVNEMTEYNKAMMMKDLSPAIEYAKQGLMEREKTEVISALSQVPELKGISDMLPQLDRIIANNKALQSPDVPMDEKYITAYAIARGVNSINTPPPAPAKDPTAEELMAFYNKNPEFQELIEKQRLEQLNQSQQVPPFAASSGAVNAALNIPKEPKTIEEADELVRKMFGA